MMMKRLVLTGLVIVVVLGIAGGGALPAAGQDETGETSPLLDMLALVPDDNMVTGGGWATVRFADFQALYITEGVEEIRQTAGTQALLTEFPLAGMLSRLVAMPNSFQRYGISGVERMLEVVGFDWITAIDRSLEYGTPPAEGLILGGVFDPDAIGAALSARDFELREMSGVPVWHRFEDAEWSLTAREPSDPFGGDLGMAARIAILPGYLANARYWDMSEAMIAAAQDEQPALANNAHYRALAEAVTAPEGWLLQALFFDGLDVGFIPDDTLAMLTEREWTDPSADYGPLPPYPLAVLADRQEGDDQVHLVGLVYGNAGQAEAAAQELAARIEAFALLDQPDEVLADYYGAAVSWRVCESESAGLAVALVEARYPLPEERTDPENGMFITGGRLYRMWDGALLQQVFFPLMVVAE